MMKVFFSLLTYLLFMVDAYMDVFWEKLDDYVYYIKATGNTMEKMMGNNINTRHIVKTLAWLATFWFLDALNDINTG
jgi:hypothetical protein